MAGEFARAWISGFTLATAVTIIAFAARVAADFTGAGDAAVMQLLNATIPCFGGEVSGAGQPVLVGLIETLAAGVAGGWIAVGVARRTSWRAALFVVVVVTLFLQLLMAAVPLRVG